MTVKYQKVWNTMNDLQMVTSKICSAREIIDNAIDKIEVHQNDKAELLMTAAYEFLEYYLQEFDEKFQDAWSATVGDLRDGDSEAYDAVLKERDYYEGKSSLSCNKDDTSPECKSAWNSFWEEPSMPPWGHSDIEYGLQYTDEEIEAMCDAAEKADKVKKWVLPVELGPSGECFIIFPDDLLEAANLKEGDSIEWINQNDGSYLMKKVEKEKQPSWVRGNELARVKTYQEMIDDGWSMTDDGFWIKEN